MQICDNMHAFMWQSMAANNCNCYLIDGVRRILIDPGHAQFLEHVESGLEALDISLSQIDLVLCTHCHPDHMEAVAPLKKAGAKFALHTEEWQLVQSLADRMGGDMVRRMTAVQPDFLLQDGDLHYGDVVLKVLHTPGHSPGSACFYWPLNRVLVSGDLVFKDGIGRTDLPGGDPRQIAPSIRLVSELDIDHLLPGHGPLVSGEASVQRNFERVGQAYLGYL